MGTASAEVLLTLDFGSEYIRVAKTRIDPLQPHILNPQVVEFGGEASLRNALLLTRGKDGAEEFGKEVFISDLAFEVPNLVLQRLSLEADPKSELGRAADYLLQYIMREAGLVDLDEENALTWQTLVSVHVGSPSGRAAELEHRLREAHFPSPRAIDSALAIFYGHHLEELGPGHYLILDFGASHTRTALYHIDEEHNVCPEGVNASGPGGRDFDRILTEHFAQVLMDTAVLNAGSQLELAYYVEEFKKQFAYEWARGNEEYTTLYPVPAAQAVLDLTLNDFTSTRLAGELIKEFRTAARRLIDKRELEPEDLRGIVLAGGGAHWPFVRRWADELVGPDKVIVSDRPEEDIVRGMVYVPASQISGSPETRSEPSPSHSPKGETRTGSSLPRSAPRQRRKSNVKTFSPSAIFWMEFVGGLVGILGLGWFAGLHKLWGCLGLVGWWVILLIGLAATGVLSVVTINPLPLFALIPIWIGIPLSSAFLAARAARRKTSDREVQEVTHA